MVPKRIGGSTAFIEQSYPVLINILVFGVDWFRYDLSVVHETMITCAKMVQQKLGDTAGRN